MGKNTYTTQDLIDRIKLKAHVPVGSQTFSPENLINLANDELQTMIISQILSTRGGYYLAYRDYEVVESGLYNIPPDCISAALENVELIQGTTIIPVNLLQEAEQFSTISPTTTSYGFFMKGNKVQILPTPNVGQARLWYAKRPGSLVLPAQCAEVLDFVILTDPMTFEPIGMDITVASIPEGMNIGDTIDVCGDQPPFNVLGEPLITNIVTNVITIDEVVEDIAVGDWLAINDQTCIPAIPVEFRPLLEQRTVAKMYEIDNKMEKYKMAMECLKELEMALFKLITPRVKSKTKVIMPVNGGFLAGNGRIKNFPAGRIS